MCLPLVTNQARTPHLPLRLEMAGSSNCNARNTSLFNVVSLQPDAPTKYETFRIVSTRSQKKRKLRVSAGVHVCMLPTGDVTDRLTPPSKSVTLPSRPATEILVHLKIRRPICGLQTVENDAARISSVPADKTSAKRSPMPIAAKVVAGASPASYNSSRNDEG